MRLVILDRDGVINEDSDDHIRHHDAFHPIAGSLEAIVKLNQAGFSVAVATNQSGISRGYFTHEDLHAMHDKLTALLEKLGGKIDGIYYCPHHPDDDCHCRKPKPGLIDDIASDFPEANLAKTFLVGDSWRDIEAGKARGLKTLLVLTGKGSIALEKHKHELGDTSVVKDLAHACEIILKETQS
ncbi:MAG: D-glycero-beta-D-manno-heptose-1,7-bisphosphate 7-phosphatase [Gammaproteobacteria bacterium CG11_big_fil_rev_8_21_14_0_20_46_22]|nr:MAG: D-glycero-beta-D-manno-heptose-1,7-bisphosphate 7-phosphatase [Gammaproteobacteria bacterium CG12_big_fil_rev_8_21_14_0_65_46_12]PIR11105.1 MAG: D-glycero-beta-D-manno-heptose-1,7-bisphosphate 7-phosphatase [Gammaproteobacteria bacterium CG11_big_fil_rev_8_21_14_0_20_46_22]